MWLKSTKREKQEKQILEADKAVMDYIRLLECIANGCA